MAKHIGVTLLLLVVGFQCLSMIMATSEPCDKPKPTKKPQPCSTEEHGKSSEESCEHKGHKSGGKGHSKESGEHKGHKSGGKGHSSESCEHKGHKSGGKGHSKESGEHKGHKSGGKGHKSGGNKCPDKC